MNDSVSKEFKPTFENGGFWEYYCLVVYNQGSEIHQFCYQLRVVYHQSLICQVLFRSVIGSERPYSIIKVNSVFNF